MKCAQYDNTGRDYIEIRMKNEEKVLSAMVFSTNKENLFFPTERKLIKKVLNLK
jgi:hypothetical protein